MQEKNNRKLLSIQNEHERETLRINYEHEEVMARITSATNLLKSLFDMLKTIAEQDPNSDVIKELFTSINSTIVGLNNCKIGWSNREKVIEG